MRTRRSLRGSARWCRSYRIQELVFLIIVATRYVCCWAIVDGCHWDGGGRVGWQGGAHCGGRLKVLKLEFVLVLAAEIIQILYLIYKIPHIWKIWDWSKSLNRTLSNDLVCLIKKKTSWGTMYNVCTCIQSHTCLGWGPDLQSSFECYWWLKLEEEKIKIENLATRCCGLLQYWCLGCFKQMQAYGL